MLSVEACHACHASQQQSDGLRLDVREQALSVGRSGTVLQPYRPDVSVLSQRVSGVDGLTQMLVGGALAAEDIETIRIWIEEGAEWPVGMPTPKTAIDWAFVAPRRPPLLPVLGGGGPPAWVRSCTPGKQG